MARSTDAKPSRAESLTDGIDEEVWQGLYIRMCVVFVC